jgi:S1-C subfamily serine protease
LEVFGMRTPALLIGGLLLAVLLFPIGAGAADSSSDAPPASLSSQAKGADAERDFKSQSSDTATLEIAPQSADRVHSPVKTDTPAERAFKPSDDVAALNRNFHPQQPNVGRRIGPADLGIDYTETNECLLGAHEDGLEVVNIYPDTPAARAGLRGPTRGTRLGDLGAFASIVVLPVGLFTMPMLRRSGMLGTSGDLIIAIDDQRVHNQQEFLKALSVLRPGDTTYVTVIRQVPGGHQSLRIAVHLDTEAELAGKLHAPDEAASSGRY